MESENFLVSIIVPVYNAEYYLARCVTALTSQTYQNIEILLVDDGSSDGSKQLCQSLAQEDTRILVFSKVNGGTASARNYGLDHANGEYVAFVDADDYVSTQYVEIHMHLIRNLQAQISVCGFFRTKMMEQSFPMYDLDTLPSQSVASNEYLYRMCDKNKTTASIICNKVYKKSLFQNSRFPEGRPYEDLASTHIFVGLATQIAVTEEKLYAYFMTDNSVTRGTYSLVNFRAENRAWDERLRYFKEYGDGKLYEKAFVSAQRNRVANYCKADRTLRDHHDEIEALRNDFLLAYKEAIQVKPLAILDRCLFFSFRYVPKLLARIVWPLYEKMTRPSDE